MCHKDIYLQAKKGELDDVPGKYGWTMLEKLAALKLIRIQKTRTGWDFYITSSGVNFANILDNEENGAPLLHVDWWTKFDGGQN